METANYLMKWAIGLTALALIVVAIIIALFIWSKNRRKVREAAIESIRSGEHMPGPRALNPRPVEAPTTFRDTRPARLIAQQEEAAKGQKPNQQQPQEAPQGNAGAKPPQPPKKGKGGKPDERNPFTDGVRNALLFEIDPLTLSICGLLIMVAIWILLIRLTSNHTDMVIMVFGGGALTLLLWAGAWRKPDEKKKDGKDCAQIPDGHLGIIEFFEIPIKLLLVTEGRLWLPWFFGAKSIDAREENHNVPPTPEQKGFGATSKDNVAMEIHCSFTSRIDRRKLYHAIFGIKPGEAVEALKNAFVAALRETVPSFDAKDLVKNANGCWGHIIGKMDGEGNFPRGTVLYNIAETAPLVALEVIEGSVKITKIDFANPETKASMESATRFAFENEGNRSRAQGIDERTQQIIQKTNGKVPEPEALLAAQREFGVLTTKQIKIDGQVPDGLLLTEGSGDAVGGDGVKGRNNKGRKKGRKQDKKDQQQPPVANPGSEDDDDEEDEEDDKP